MAPSLLLLVFVAAAPVQPEEEGAIPRLTLEEAISAAMIESLDIVRAKEDLLLADVDKMRSLSTVLPSINFSSAANEQFWGRGNYEARSPIDGPFTDTPVTPYNNANINLQLSGRQVIYDGGRWWTLLARSEDIRLFRECSVRAVRGNVRLLVVRRFYDLAKATRGVETFSAQVKLDEDQLKRALEQLRVGKVRQNDVAAAERNFAADRVTLARRLNTESSRARLLNLSLGRDPDILFRLVIPKEVETTTVSLQAISIPRTEVLLDEALHQRAEVIGSLANLEILRKNLLIRGADNLPTVGVNAYYSRASRRPDRVVSDPFLGYYYAFLGLDIRWNLLAGGATRANVEEGQIELRKGEESHEDLLRQVKSEVLDKVEQLRLLAQVFELNRAGVRAAEAAVKQVTAAYAENKATLFELSDAQLRLSGARDVSFEARFDLEVAVEELRRAVGGEVLDRVDVPLQEIR